MLRPIRLACAVAVALGARVASGAVLADDWYTSLIQGKRAGYLHVMRETASEGGKAVVRTSMETRFTLLRMGTELSVASSAVFLETAAGEPIRFENSNRFSANEYNVRAERRNDHFLVTQESMGQKTETEVPLDGEVLFPHAMEREIAARGLKPGARLELKTFAPDAARPTRTTIECKGFEEVELDAGRRERLLRLDSTQDLIPGLTLSEWRDATGTVQKTLLPLLGLEIVSLRTSRENALLGPESVELLVSTLVEPDVGILRSRAVERARFRLSFKDPKALYPIPEDSRQRLVGRDGHALILEVSRESWSKDKAANRPGEVYLRPNSVLQSADPQVMMLAERAAPEGSPADVAREINRWVHRSIRKKTLSVGLATAAEVARDLTGDCTEHAVLAAALGRARGLPTKVAMGLVYLDGFFGYHMWFEVFDHGWHALDPALGEDATNATHIKLAESALDQGFVDEAIIGLVRVISNLDIKVIEYQIGGQVLAGQTAAAAGAIREGSYANPVYGLRLEPPRPWRLLPRPDSSRFTLLRLEGPGGSTGELAARSVSYAFDLDRWVDDENPGQRREGRNTVVAKKPGKRYRLEGKDGSEGLLAFVADGTLFTLRLRPFGKAEEAALDQFIGAIEIHD